MESDVREKILETARCIFLKEGYKGTTINSIAGRVGSPRPPSTCTSMGKRICLKIWTFRKKRRCRMHITPTAPQFFRRR